MSYRSKRDNSDWKENISIQEQNFVGLGWVRGKHGTLYGPEITTMNTKH
jgi:hypothetical protein